MLVLRSSRTQRSVLICQLYLLLTHGVSVNTTMLTSRYFEHPCSRSVFTLLWHAPVNTTYKTGHAYQPLPTINLYQTSDYSGTLRDWKHMLEAGITVTQHVFEEPFWRYLQLTFCCANLWHMKETIWNILSSNQFFLRKYLKFCFVGVLLHIACTCTFICMNSYYTQHSSYYRQLIEGDVQPVE